ncbi:uncharacterized protein BO95DRAFT_202166 [Aspergillus brunneoviolaceus CBS 621.78]|uniref:Uncharacterized protein n=1 Tax=Aspergillus brunneoviolaceus CBS 621.78 TaxID=1450534 RepID=A0ACD1G358_9EURO|nr:hypothetical protein BO95DRAFT_202166 [Aspergillus brunneoviolaceus CBS 621.78]RAH43709.1 hypothetical protein BO95DRAFT_202166 [Aspergillus brunneoviolaceus CBS 621.78]
MNRFNERSERTLLQSRPPNWTLFIVSLRNIPYLKSIRLTYCLIFYQSSPSSTAIPANATSPDVPRAPNDRKPPTQNKTAALESFSCMSLIVVTTACMRSVRRASCQGYNISLRTHWFNWRSSCNQQKILSGPSVSRVRTILNSVIRLYIYLGRCL